MRPTQLTSLYSFLSLAASKYLDRPAVISEGREYSYQALLDRADIYARALLEYEQVGEGVVGLCFSRSFDMIAAMLGILKVGLGYLPLDPSYPIERLSYMIEDSGARLVLGDEKALRSLEFLNLDGVTILDKSRINPKAMGPVAAVAHPKLAYLIYTSGTTGKPKGVAVGHNQVGHLIEWANAEIDVVACERTLQFSPLSFDPSVLEIFTTLATGKTLVLIDEQERKDPEALLDFLIENKIERAIFPAAILQLLASEANGLGKYPQHLKVIICGGEALKIGRDYVKFFKNVPDVKLFNQYGPTEATVAISSLKLEGDPGIWPELPSIGHAKGENVVYVVDSELCPVADGLEGELIITGPMLAMGYWKRPELTSEKFINLKVKDATVRGYRTGDLVIRNKNGQIAFRGRIDEQVKVNGVRVELGELESSILSNSSVSEVAVKKIETSHGAALAVFYVGEVSENSLRTELAKSLPAQIMPAAFVKRNKLPTTANGKIDKRALPQTLAEITEAKEVAPKVKTSSSILRELYQEILGHNEFSDRQTFFEAGGTSLQAIALAKNIRKQFKISLPIALFFENSDLEKLSMLLSGDNKSQALSRERQGRAKERDVAIVGMACRFPGAESLEAYWKLLKEGREGIRFFSDAELDSTVDPRESSAANYVKARGVLKGIDLFDARYFDLSPRVAELMDPQMRLMLEESVHALEHAGINPERTQDRIGVYFGISNNSYYLKNVSAHPDKIKSISEWTVSTLNEKDYIATQVAHKLNLKGPALSIHTACSTSLVAIAEAYKSISRGDCEVALAGAINADAARNSGHLYQEGGIRSIDGHCRPFDSNASGTVFSDGVGIVVLKDLERAIADGDEIHAVIKGAGVNNDGAGKMSFTAPSFEGQKRALEMALSDAGVDPSSVDMIECHGTATPIGDPIEFMALKEAYKIHGRKKPVYLGSVKSNIGHTVTAAGVAGVIKSVLALKNELIPATLHYKSPNPELSLADSGYEVAGANISWPKSNQYPRRAGVSAFGVGGTNAHLIIEEYARSNMGKQLRETSARSELFIFSAKSSESLLSLLGQYEKRAEEYNLRSLAATLALKARHYQKRAYIVAASAAELSEKLRAEIVKRTKKKASVVAPGALIAFITPGQGAQYLGMGRELYANHPIFRATCDELFSKLVGTDHADLKEVMFEESEGDPRISQTFYTQPALYIFELALARVLISLGVNPEALLGHSVGEFAGLVLAQVMDQEDALEIICERAKLMNSLPHGKMLSVRTSKERTLEIVKRSDLGDQVQLAAHNSPQLCVVAGTSEGIHSLELALASEGIACKSLITSHAFHSHMMKPIAKKLSSFVAAKSLSVPRLSVFSTLTGKKLLSAPTNDYFSQQATLPVEFTSAVNTLFSEAVKSSRELVFIDLGPRSIMATMACQIAKEQEVRAKFLAVNKSGEEWVSFLESVGELWGHGLELDFTTLFSGAADFCASKLAPYQFNRKSYWLDNLNQQYKPSRGMKVSVQELIKSDLIHLFAESSGFGIEDISSDQSFLELGFDSLLLTQIAIEVERTFGVKITFRDLIDQFSSIDLLTRHLEGVLPASTKAKYSSSEASVAPVAPVTFSVPAPKISNPIAAGADQLQLSPLSTSASSSTIESIILGQMQLMQAHLQMLSGVQVSAPKVEAPSAPAVAPKASSLDKRPLASESNAATELKATVNTATSAFGAQARINTQRGRDSESVSEAVREIIERYSKQLAGSKEFTQKYRRVNADPRVVTGFRPELKEMTFPVVVNRSKGQHLWDVDGNEYIDMTCGFGSNFFGNHNPRITAALHDQIDRGFEIGPQHELVGDCAELICEFTGLERAAFCNTGSEAVLGALRVARTVTGRKKIVSFKGSYHGINDEVIVRGLNDGKAMPAAAGINRSSVSDIIVLDYGTEEALEHIRAHISEIAAVICEPVQSRRSDFRPVEFLKAVRKITAESGAALIFDEVITGFRIAKGGCQEYFGIKADLATYGKIVGGGMPIGVIAGISRFMDALDGGHWSFGDDSVPTAPLTYFAGTFVRHPLALRAMREALLILKEGGNELYENINKRAQDFVSQINLFCKMIGAPIHVDNFGGVLKPRSTDAGPYNDLFYALMRLSGVHVYDGFPWFVTLGHTEEDLSRVISIFKKCVVEMQDIGLFVASNNLVEGKTNRDASTSDDFLIPPAPGAKLGRDENGMPAWFIADEANSEKLKKIL